MCRFRPAAALIASGLFLAGAADAATVTQVVNLPATTLIAGVNSDTTVSSTITATFDKFDPTLGVLTDASFAYDYRLNVTATTGPNGGTVSGVAGGPFEINDQARGGSGNGGSASGSPNTMAVVPFPVGGTQAADAADLPGLIATGPGQSNTFDYDLRADIRFDAADERDGLVQRDGRVLRDRHLHVHGRPRAGVGSPARPRRRRAAAAAAGVSRAAAGFNDFGGTRVASPVHFRVPT